MGLLLDLIMGPAADASTAANHDHDTHRAPRTRVGTYTKSFGLGTAHVEVYERRGRLINGFGEDITDAVARNHGHATAQRWAARGRR